MLAVNGNLWIFSYHCQVSRTSKPSTNYKREPSFVHNEILEQVAVIYHIQPRVSDSVSYLYYKIIEFHTKKNINLRKKEGCAHCPPLHLLRPLLPLSLPK